jgi:hypothetical protein
MQNRQTALYELVKLLGKRCWPIFTVEVLPDCFVRGVFLSGGNETRIKRVVKRMP